VSSRIDLLKEMGLVDDSLCLLGSFDTLSSGEKIVVAYIVDPTIPLDVNKVDRMIGKKLLTIQVNFWTLVWEGVAR